MTEKERKLAAGINRMLARWAASNPAKETWRN
jgi:hypothetical protein